MKHCYMCGHDFEDQVRMVMARGGSHLCVDCANTERGKREVDALLADRTSGRPRHTIIPRWAFARAKWLHQPKPQIELIDKDKK